MSRASDFDIHTLTERSATGDEDASAILDLRDSLAALTRRVEAMEANHSKTSNSSPAKCPECGGHGWQVQLKERRLCPFEKPDGTLPRRDYNPQCWNVRDCPNPACTAKPTPPAEQPEVESAEEFWTRTWDLPATEMVRRRDIAIAAAARKAAVREFLDHLSAKLGHIKEWTVSERSLRTAAREYAK